MSARTTRTGRARTRDAAALAAIDAAADDAASGRAEAALRERALEARLREAERDKEALARLVEREQERLAVALAIREHREPPKIPPRRKQRDKVYQGAALALASDWHVEERVDPRTINGVNEYTPDIARERARRFFVGVEWMVNVLAGGEQRYQIDDLVLWLGGDMMTGYIHEELMESNFMSPTKALLFAQELLASGIDYLLAQTHVARLVVVCSHGNHGRTTPKRRVSTAAENSYEWLMFHILAQRYAAEPRVTFHVADGAHVYVEVMEHVVRFHHGDDVRYAGGVGGLSIPLRKAVDAWNVTRRADLTCVGHWHQYADYGDALVNGSLIGHSAYAQSIKARFEPPRQAFCVLDPERGKRFVSPILVG